MTLALGAVNAEHVLEQVGHDPVRLLHLDFLVALSAGQIPVGFVIVCDVALVSGELQKTRVACTRGTLRTLKNVRYHEHADWAFEVLRLDTQTRVLVKVCLLHTVDNLVISVVCLHHLFIFFQVCYFVC